MKHYACVTSGPSYLFLVGVVAHSVPGCDTNGTPFLAGWKELLRGSILLLGMFFEYSLASRKLNETSSFEVGREDITSLLLDAEGTN